MGQRHVHGVFVSRQSLIRARNREPQAKITLSSDVHVAIDIIDVDGGLKGDQKIRCDIALEVERPERPILDHDAGNGLRAEVHARRRKSDVHVRCSRKLDPLRVPDIVPRARSPVAHLEIATVDSASDIPRDAEGEPLEHFPLNDEAVLIRVVDGREGGRPGSAADRGGDLREDGGASELRRNREPDLPFAPERERARLGDEDRPELDVAHRQFDPLVLDVPSHRHVEVFELAVGDRQSGRFAIVAAELHLDLRDLDDDRSGAGEIEARLIPRLGRVEVPIPLKPHLLQLEPGLDGDRSLDVDSEARAHRHVELVELAVGEYQPRVRGLGLVVGVAECDAEPLGLSIGGEADEGRPVKRHEANVGRATHRERLGEASGGGNVLNLRPLEAELLGIDKDSASEEGAGDGDVERPQVVPHHLDAGASVITELDHQSHRHRRGCSAAHVRHDERADVKPVDEGRGDAGECHPLQRGVVGEVEVAGVDLHAGE